MSSESKDTIYIDVDDEITSIIDKVSSSKKKIVALVLPKRASVLQSVVNMKLLKRKADDADKNLVLITSEAGLLPLAGATGIHVAKTLQSKPEIPEGPKEDEEKQDEELEELYDEPEEVDKAATVGALAGAAAVGAADKDKSEDTIDLDNTEDEAPPKKDAKKGKGDKKKKVPNFNSFRKKLFLGIGAFIAVILLWFVAFRILPKATITIQTETSDLNANTSFTVDTAAKEVDLPNSIVPGIEETLKKTETQTGNATGKKDVGTKATGSVTIKNCEDTNARNLAAGSAFTASTGQVFVSNNGVTVPAGQFSNGGQNCNSQSVSVGVTASASGDSYNISATSYSSSSLPGKFTISGSNMTGGTSKTITVVSQQDLDTAKAKLTDQKQAAQDELTKKLQSENLVPLTGTIGTPTPTISVSPAVDSEASTFTVTSTTDFTMLGANKDDLEKVISDNVKDQLDEDKQQIQNYNFDNVNFAVNGKPAATQTLINMQGTLVVGPKINVDDLKKQVAGKKKNSIRDSISETPGVKEVTVKFSPFWVGKATKNTSKITINFESNSNDNNSNP